jgi:predicted GIY-YIG superfamily endonuclease
MAQLFVYILTNRRYGVLYVGVTNDLARRIEHHRAKVVRGFTAKYGLVKLVYFENSSRSWKLARENTALKDGSARGSLRWSTKSILNGVTLARSLSPESRRQSPGHGVFIFA